MTSLATIHFLRLVHVVVGVFWVGSVLFIAGLLMPSIRAAGPAAGGAVMRQLVESRKLPIWLMAASALTILSGLGLYWVDSAGFQSAWLASGPGRTFGLGGALAIAAGLLGMIVNAPAARRLGEVAAAAQAAGRPPTAEEAAEIARLQTRLNRATNGAAALLLLAAVAMAVGRYVP